MTGPAPWEIRVLIAGALALMAGLAAMFWLDWWWAGLPALALFTSVQASTLARNWRARWWKGVAMSVWGLALCVMAVAITFQWWWVAWPLMILGLGGAVFLLFDGRKDMARVRDLERRMRENGL